jgi:folate-binding protein YgfZ
MTLHAASRVRRAAGLFRLEDRGILEVAGGDARRWLNGMVSNDVSSLQPGPERSGCYALLLTRQGRIVADFHVMVRGVDTSTSFWLEMAAEAVPLVTEQLANFIVADDVELSDRTRDVGRIAVEGPTASAVMERALGEPPGLAENACADVVLAGSDCLLAAFGFSGEPAYQVFVPKAELDSVAAALSEAGEGNGLVSAEAEVLEMLRIEAGRPRFGSELDESTLPAEARLDDAVSTTKGCYTGQEVVARLASQGRVKHMLVGLCGDEATPLGVGAVVESAGKSVGEVTSACVSPDAGSIALAFVTRPHDEPGTVLAVEGRDVRVAALPFTAIAS